MSKTKTTPKPRRPARSRKDDKPATPADRLRAIISVLKDGGYARPGNPLIHSHPADTIVACQQVVDWLAHIEQPFEGENMDVAEMYVLRVIVDALGQAERITTDLFNAAQAFAEVKS